MATNIKNRVPAYPGRVKLLPVAGQADTYTMTRADAPTEPGTAVNKALLDAIGVHTLDYAKSGTVHGLTGLNGAAGVIACQFKATAGFAAGDSVTVDGAAYTIQLSNGKAAKKDLFVSGSIVSCILDTAGKTVNFKAGGGYAEGDVIAAGNLAEVRERSLNFTDKENLFTMAFNSSSNYFKTFFVNPAGDAFYVFSGSDNSHTNEKLRVYNAAGDLIASFSYSIRRFAGFDTDGNFYGIVREYSSTNKDIAVCVKKNGDSIVYDLPGDETKNELMCGCAIHGDYFYRAYANSDSTTTKICKYARGNKAVVSTFSISGNFYYDTSYYNYYYSDIAVSEAGVIFIADKKNNTLYSYTESGTRQLAVALPSSNFSGTYFYMSIMGTIPYFASYSQSSDVYSKVRRLTMQMTYDSSWGGSLSGDEYIRAISGGGGSVLKLFNAKDKTFSGVSTRVSDLSQEILFSGSGYLACDTDILAAQLFEIAEPSTSSNDYMVSCSRPPITGYKVLSDD